MTLSSLLSLKRSSIIDDQQTLSRSDSFEILLPDIEAFNEVYDSSFDEIMPEEMGIDVANSEEVEEHSLTVFDNEQAVNFPPWKVQRLMLDLKGLTLDAGMLEVKKSVNSKKQSVD